MVRHPGVNHEQSRHGHSRSRHRQSHPCARGGGGCVRPYQYSPSGKSKAFFPRPLGRARTGRARGHRRIGPRRPTGARGDARALSRTVHSRGHLRGAARRAVGRPRPRGGHSAVRDRAGDPASPGHSFRQLHRRQGAGVGHRRQVRRHQSVCYQHGAGPRSRQMSRRQQRRVDAGPRLCFGGALAHRGGADVGLSAAQRACVAARQAIGRRDHVSAARRDRCPQSRLQPLFAGNLAGLGILGEQSRLWSHARQARPRARSQEGVNPDLGRRVARELVMSATPENLDSYLSGRWLRGEGIETILVDPVTGDELATVSAKGLDLKAALEFARGEGQLGLRGLSYGERAKLVGAVADVLTANRARYEAIAIANSGNTKADAAIDIDGGIGTLKYYARLGAGLGDARTLLDEKPVRFAKAENYQAIHLMVPRRGVAVHINAFNFPSWGLWEKAAVALLAGVPVLAKPASATALL